MNDIDFLEYGGGGFAIRLRGETIPLLDPRALNYQVVLAYLSAQHAPGTPDMLEWQRALVFDRWRAAWDLPPFREAQRLAYLLDHYRRGITYDLRVHAGVDVGHLWRERRWVHLLDLLDHLPGHSWYAASVTMDEEHAKMMAEALSEREKAGEKSEDKGPALTGWTQEVAALTNILDAVRGVTHAVVAVNSPKGKTPEPPKPAPRPVTPLERAMKAADFRRKKAKHESLVARMLPHKAQSKG